jgi:hypothetical protein
MLLDGLARRRVGVIVTERVVMCFHFAYVGEDARCAFGMEGVRMDSRVCRWMWCR